MWAKFNKGSRIPVQQNYKVMEEIDKDPDGKIACLWINLSCITMICNVDVESRYSFFFSLFVFDILL